MKKAMFSLVQTAMQIILLLAVCFFSLGTAGVKPAYASTPDSTCGQLLADANAQFMATLSADGSVTTSPETRAAATQYIRIAKLCYDEIAAQNSTSTSQGALPTFIDDGGILLGDPSSAEFVLTGGKWGSNVSGTSGGTVTYSFMGNGLDLSAEPNSSNFGTSVALTSLPGFQVCFVSEIQNAFTAWQAVSNIQFVQVEDSKTAFGAPGATGDIRIGAHAFDGPSGILAHAYFPSSKGGSGTGDMHFDKAENWTCDTSGINIGIVALHEIGHALGLNHEDTSAVAVMDPYYNPSVTGLQTDDINGITAIYGPAAITVAAPANDDLANATPITNTPYGNSVDTTGAVDSADGPTVPAGGCDGKNLQHGLKDVWYRYTPTQNKLVYLDTFGSTRSIADHEYDTYIAVWTSSVPNPTPAQLTFFACNDDDNSFLGLQSQLALAAQAGTTYFIEVAQNAGVVGIPPATPTGGALQFHITSFVDVPGNNWAWRFIEGLYKASVTAGCSDVPRQYCPGIVVSRDQMAVFLLKAKYGIGYMPPPAGTGTGFNDVPPTYWAAAWIKELALEGITSGCGGGNYCPADPVARDQMAVFLLRTKYGNLYTPPPVGSTTGFADVSTTYWAATWIKELAAEGISGGCGGGNYCPSAVVTRDQMSVFLDTTFSITPTP